MTCIRNDKRRCKKVFHEANQKMQHKHVPYNVKKLLPKHAYNQNYFHRLVFYEVRLQVSHWKI